MNIIIETHNNEFVFNLDSVKCCNKVAAIIWELWKTQDREINAPVFYTEGELGKFRVNNQLVSYSQIFTLVKNAKKQTSNVPYKEATEENVRYFA